MCWSSFGLIVFPNVVHLSLSVCGCDAVLMWYAKFVLKLQGELQALNDYQQHGFHGNRSMGQADDESAEDDDVGFTYRPRRRKSSNNMTFKVCESHHCFVGPVRRDGILATDASLPITPSGPLPPLTQEQLSRQIANSTSERIQMERSESQIVEANTLPAESWNGGVAKVRPNCNVKSRAPPQA